MPRPAHAGDGQIQWRTWSAPGVEIHAPAPLREMAELALATLADARQALQPLFSSHVPKLHLTLDDYSDDANGFATVLPFDHVHLQAYPPSPADDLGDHGDWLRQLIFHEFTHVLHMEEVSGLPAASHYVVGHRWYPNAVLPRFVLEGLAVHVETRHTGRDAAVAGHGGRIDSPQYQALMRAAVMDHNWPDLQQMTGTPLRWPRGNSWYVFGSLLIDDIVRQFGHAKLLAFLQAYGAHVIPFGINGLSREVWGHSLQRLWADASARYAARVQAQWRDLSFNPQTKTFGVHAESDARLTLDGNWRGRIRPGTRPSSVVVAHSPNDQLNVVEEIDAITLKRRLIHVCELDCDEPMIAPGGRWLLFTESRRTERLYLFRELIAVQLPEDTTASWVPSDQPLPIPSHWQPSLRLTQGARVRSPSFAQDGKEIVYISIVAGKTEVRSLPWPQLLQVAQADRPQPPSILRLAAPPVGETLDSPMQLVATDGYKLLYDHGVGAGRPVWQQGLGQARSRQLPGSWLDLQLRTDGQLIAVQTVGDFRVASVADLAQGTVLAQSRTPTGVVSATQGPNLQTVVTVEHVGQGLDVFVRTLQPQPQQPIAASELPYAPTPVQGLESPYQPWRHFWPRAWYPLAVTDTTRATTDPGALWLGATLYGSDALSHWNWSLFGQLRDDGTDPLVYASAALTAWEPTLTLDAAYQQGIAYFIRGYRYRATPTDRTGARFSVAWDLPGLRDTWQFSADLRMTHSALRQPWYRNVYPYDPSAVVPTEPWVGQEYLSDVSVYWLQSQQYADSTIAEKLHLIGLTGTVGARQDGQMGRVVINATTEHHWPLGQHRVLAITANGAYQALAPPGDPGFAVHGLQPLAAQSIFGSVASGLTVRGLGGQGGDALGGNAAVWGTLALHLPLFDVGRGLDVLPVFGRRVSLVPFSDFAALGSTLPAQGLRGGAIVTAGAELRMDYEFGYIPWGLVRLGLARGMGPLGDWNGYFALGLQ